MNPTLNQVKKHEYGKIAGNKSINTKIYACFKYLCKKDVLQFVKKFGEQPHGQEQVMHTFRELILGAFLASNGLVVRYDYRVGRKTPDWCIFDDKSSLLGITELINFNIDKRAEIAQNRQIEAGRMWWGYVKPNNPRLYQRIGEKADLYCALVTKYNVPYVVSVFSDFRAVAKIDEVRQCLFEDHGGLFNLCPRLSGVLFFEELSGQYCFEYIRNPHSVIGIDLPSGVF